MPRSTASRALSQLWLEAALPASSLLRVRFTGSDSLPSSFLLADAAQASIASGALAAAEILALRSGQPLSEISVSAEDAAAEFRSEQLGTLNGEVSRSSLSSKPLHSDTSLVCKAEKVWDDLAGQYKAKDGGWLRPHTNWAHHKLGLLKLMGLPSNATKSDLASVFADSDVNEVAERAMSHGLVASAMRSFGDW
jgi:hypothetical protein